MKNTKKLAVICGIGILLSSFSIAGYGTSVAHDPPSQVDGIFRINKIIAENFRGQRLFLKYQVAAYFPTDTLGLISLGNRKFGGELHLNNNVIAYFNNFQFYIDTAIDLSGANGFNWQNSGSSVVDAFSFVNTKSLPAFNYSTINLPATIDTSVDLQIELDQLSAVDSVFINFSRSDSVSRPPFLTKRFGTEGNVFTVDKKRFKQFYAGQELYMQIEVSNYTRQIIGGKNYYFVNSFDYRKKVTIASAP